MTSLEIKRAFQDGRPAFGAALASPDELAAQLTINAGPDFLWIDTEHIPYGVESFRMPPVLARMKGVMPMIRVVCLDPGHIKKALDAGAAAVMIPQVDNAEQARLAVRYAKYPPVGTRGVSPMWSHFLGVDWKDYLPTANEETMVVTQIESAEGVANVDAIAAVEGVDVIFAGPADLAASFGHIGDPSHPKVRQLIADLPKRASAHGKAAGIALGSADAAIEAFEMGYRFINFTSIFWDGSRGMQAGLARVREATARRP